MEIKREKNSIILKNIDFDIKEILECGQIFSFYEENNSYIVVSSDKICKITKDENFTKLESDDINYFYNFFDLDTDYEKIKKEILKLYPNFFKFFEGGKNIRILRQDPYQTIISFIVSSNNNIKRIKKILFSMSQKFGEKQGEIYLFPTLLSLKNASIQDYKDLGAGYRSEYLYKSVKMLLEKDYEEETLKSLPTKELKKRLLNLSGVGEKVADCILFFGFNRTDVFPVDTWIRKGYSYFCEKKRSDKEISSYFVDIFKNYSGYAQQYLYNYMIFCKNPN